MKIRNSIYGTVMALGISLSLPLVTNAANPAEISVTKERSEVSLKIHSKGDYYKIFKDKELVYVGEDSTYLENIQDDSQKYKIGVYSNDKLKEVVSVKVAKEHNIKKPKSMKTEAKEDYVKNVVHNTSLQTIVDSQSVTLQWPELPDEDNIYEIFRDDVKIAETSDLQYVDRNVESGMEYYYTLKITNVASDELAKKVRSIAKKENKKVTNDALEYDGTISTILSVPTVEEKSLTEDPVLDEILNEGSTILDGKVSPMALPNSNTFSFDYRTYIPMASVPNPSPIEKGKYPHLQGDNRTGPLPTSLKYRTQSSVTANLSAGSLAFYPKVSDTHYCSVASCASPIYLGTASTNGIVFTKAKAATNNLVWKMKHAVGIPKITAPAINYEYAVTLTNTKLKANGYHDKAPSHEFYLTYPSGSKKIFSHQVTSVNDFWLLFGLPVGSWNFEL